MNNLIEFPIGFYDKKKEKWYKFAEIKELYAESLMILGERKYQKNPYMIFLQLMQKGIVSIQDENQETLNDMQSKLKKLAMIDAIFANIEIIGLTKGDFKLCTSYKCNRCQEFTIFEEIEDEENAGNFIDNREDIKNIKIGRIPLEKLTNFTFSHNVDIGFVNENGEHFNKYLMEYPTLETYINVFNFTDNPLEQEREVYFRSMISVNDLDERSMNSLKTKYSRKIFLPKITEYNNLKKRLQKLGYNLDSHTVVCSNCGAKINGKFDLTNFFGSILPA